MNDEKPDNLNLFKVAPRRYAAFTKAGDYLQTLDYDDARPLMFCPKSRAAFLKFHEGRISGSGVSA